MATKLRKSSIFESKYATFQWISVYSLHPSAFRIVADQYLIIDPDFHSGIQSTLLSVPASENG
jgi:hypothetical protein